MPERYGKTLWTPLLVAQQQTDANPKKPGSSLIDYLLNYLNMAGTKKSNEFVPMTQAERNRLYLKTMMNPLGFVKAGFSAGIDQANEQTACHSLMPPAPTPRVCPTSWGSIPSSAQ